MPEQVSLSALQGMLAKNTDVVYLVRLEITHPDLSEPMRLINDKQGHYDESGVEWRGFPFQAVFPEDDEEQIPKAELVVSNVSRDLTLAIRNLSSRPSASIDVVSFPSNVRYLAAPEGSEPLLTTRGHPVKAVRTPWTVEKGPFNFDVLGYEASADTIRLTVGPAVDFLNAAFPKDRFLPSNAGE